MNKTPKKLACVGLILGSASMTAAPIFNVNFTASEFVQNESEELFHS